MADDSFFIFWSKYPKKVAKLDAQKAWNKMSEAQRQAAIETISHHVKRWEDLNFIPHAASWLRGERYLDELPPEYCAAPVVRWWQDDQATLAYGNQKGMRPRPGESMSEYRSRLKAA